MKVDPKKMAAIKMMDEARALPTLRQNPRAGYANGSSQTGEAPSLNQEFGAPDRPRPPLGNEMVTGRAMNAISTDGPLVDTSAQHGDPMQSEIDKGGHDFLQAIKARNRHIKGKR